MDPAGHRQAPLHSLFRRIQTSPHAFWTTPVFAHPVGLLLFWLLAVLLVVLRCRVGLFGTNYVSHDAFMVIDGAWRMLHHQRPHADFNSMIGPVAYLPAVVGIRLAHNTARGLAWGQAFLGLLLAAWTFLLGKQLPDLPRAFYSLCVLAYVLSPAQLGISPFFLTPGMTYNRAAYGLLAVVLLECLLPSRRMHFLQGASTGVVLVLLALLKFTTVLPCTLLLLLLIPQKPQTRARWIGMATGALVVGLTAAVYYGFHFRPLLYDLSLTMGAKQVHMTTLYSYDTIFLEACLGIVVAAGIAANMSSPDKPHAGRRLLLGAVAVAILSVLLVLSNWQQAELPLLTLYLLVAIAQLATVPEPASDARLMRHISAAGVATFALVPLLSLCAALADGMYAHDVWSRQVPHMAFTNSLKEFVPVEGDTDYTDFVNNGMFLLKTNIRPGERVMSLDFTNPFSFGLGIPPAPGGSTNLQFGGSFNGTHFVPPERLFGQAELVMMPLAFSDATLQTTVPAMYGPYLHTHYHLVATLKRWQLYRRN